MEPDSWLRLIDLAVRAAVFAWRVAKRMKGRRAVTRESRRRRGRRVFPARTRGACQRRNRTFGRGTKTLSRIRVSRR